jgi:hypothetical protein
MMQLIDLPKEANILQAEVMRFLFATYATDERKFDGKDTFQTMPEVLRKIADVFEEIEKGA